MGEMSHRHGLFVEEYLVDGNATQAAIRAGYSLNTAKMQGSRLMSYDAIRAAVDAGRAQQLARATMTADEVIRELTLLARSNSLDYVTIGANGDPYVDLSKLTRDQAAAISEITTEDYVDGRGDNARDVRKVKIKLADKRAALVDLGKHFGIFMDKQVVRFEGQVSHDWTVKVVAPKDIDNG